MLLYIYAKVLRAAIYLHMMIVLRSYFIGNLQCKYAVKHLHNGGYTLQRKVHSVHICVQM